jgi:hypothetical protein
MNMSQKCFLATCISKRESSMSDIYIYMCVCVCVCVCVCWNDNVKKLSFLCTIRNKEKT